MLNKLKLLNKDFLSLPDDQPPIFIEGVTIRTDLSCLVKSYSRSDTARIGGILLNTQVGEGLGMREITRAKRKKAGETVSLLILRRMINEFSDIGEPHPDDCLHVYINGDHYWSAPKSYQTRLGNLEADARSVVATWDRITPPDNFDPKRAKFHD